LFSLAPVLTTRRGTDPEFNKNGNELMGDPSKRKRNTAPPFMWLKKAATRQEQAEFVE